LKAIDSTAVSLCRDFKMPLILFSMKEEKYLIKAVLEGKFGTTIKED